MPLGASFSQALNLNRPRFSPIGRVPVYGRYRSVLIEFLFQGAPLVSSLGWTGWDFLLVLGPNPNSAEGIITVDRGVTTVRLLEYVEGSWFTRATFDAGFVTGPWYEIRIELIGAVCRIYVNGVLRINYTTLVNANYERYLVLDPQGAGNNGGEDRIALTRFQEYFQ